jgi:hypothetical protein
LRLFLVAAPIDTATAVIAAACSPPSFITGYPVQRGSHPSGGVSGGDHNSLPQQRLLAERKWRLGLVVRGHPSALMAELYRVLQVGTTGTHTRHYTWLLRVLL